MSRAKTKRPKPKLGRPPGRRWKPLMLSMTPERLALAKQLGGGKASKGVYALLDLAMQDSAVVAKASGLANVRKPAGKDSAA